MKRISQLEGQQIYMKGKNDFVLLKKSQNGLKNGIGLKETGRECEKRNMNSNKNNECNKNNQSISNKVFGQCFQSCNSIEFNRNDYHKLSYKSLEKTKLHVGSKQNCQNQVVKKGVSTTKGLRIVKNDQKEQFKLNMGNLNSQPSTISSERKQKCNDFKEIRFGSFKGSQPNDCLMNDRRETINKENCSQTEKAVFLSKIGLKSSQNPKGLLNKIVLTQQPQRCYRKFSQQINPTYSTQYCSNSQNLNNNSNSKNFQTVFNPNIINSSLNINKNSFLTNLNLFSTLDTSNKYAQTKKQDTLQTEQSKSIAGHLFVPFQEIEAKLCESIKINKQNIEEEEKMEDLSGIGGDKNYQDEDYQPVLLRNLNFYNKEAFFQFDGMKDSLIDKLNIPENNTSIVNQQAKNAQIQNIKSKTKQCRSYTNRKRKQFLRSNKNLKIENCQQQKQFQQLNIKNQNQIKQPIKNPFISSQISLKTQLQQFLIDQPTKNQTSSQLITSTNLNNIKRKFIYQMDSIQTIRPQALNLDGMADMNKKNKFKRLEQCGYTIVSKYNKSQQRQPILKQSNIIFQASKMFEQGQGDNRIKQNNVKPLETMDNFVNIPTFSDSQIVFSCQSGIENQFQFGNQNNRHYNSFDNHETSIRIKQKSEPLIKQNGLEKEYKTLQFGEMKFVETKEGFFEEDCQNDGANIVNNKRNNNKASLKNHRNKNFIRSNKNKKHQQKIADDEIRFQLDTFIRYDY